MISCTQIYQLNYNNTIIMEKSTKSIAVNYGLYLGLGLTAITAICYAVDILLLNNTMVGVGLLLLVIILHIMSSIATKKAQGGYISFKDAFTSFFITLAIGLLISSLVYIVIFNFIDPEAAETLKNAVMEKQIEMMKGFGADPKMMSGIAEEFEKQGNMYSIANVLKSFVFQLAGYSLIGLISSLIIKKNEETQI